MWFMVWLTLFPIFGSSRSNDPSLRSVRPLPQASPEGPGGCRADPSTATGPSRQPGVARCKRLHAPYETFEPAASSAQEGRE